MENKNGPGLSFNQGRAFLYIKGHPRGNSRGYVLRSIVFAEKVLGKPLPPKVEVHHVDEITSDDRFSNLVICQDRAFHKLLHARTRAYYACGHANWLKCPFCKEYDDPKHLIVYVDKSGRRQHYHKNCRNEYRRSKWIPKPEGLEA